MLYSLSISTCFERFNLIKEQLAMNTTNKIVANSFENKLFPCYFVQTCFCG